jgi:CubicO group peptidase (beta-lactamase class C family)
LPSLQNVQKQHFTLNPVRKFSYIYRVWYWLKKQYLFCMRYFFPLFVLLAIVHSVVNAQDERRFIFALDTLMHSFFSDSEPGSAVLIAKNGEVIYKKGFGIEDIKTRSPITPQSVFNLGSISKTFVAYGILKLAEEERLSLDDDLFKYFPDFKNPGIAKKVKLYHLLTHTSGLPDLRRVKEDSIFYLTAKDEENWEPIRQTDSLLFEPGEKFNYSNPAFNALALIIEKVTGLPWQNYIRMVIFQPAGMQTSTITDGPYPQAGVVHGYVLNGKSEFEEKDYGEEPTFAAAGNGGVWSSVEELWNYEQAIQKNLFLTKSTIEKSRTVFRPDNWKDKQPPNLGMSWFLTKEMNLQCIGHTGSQGGFVSDYLWIPEKNIFYVLLCNTPKPIRTIRTRVFELMKKYNWLDGK